MSELNYGYQLYKGFVAIIPLQGSNSVYIHLDGVLAELKSKIPSFEHKHILCEGQDGLWHLILPVGKLGLTETRIYPLNALTLAKAKQKFDMLIFSKEYLRIIA